MVNTSKNTNLHETNPSKNTNLYETYSSKNTSILKLFNWKYIVILVVIVTSIVGAYYLYRYVKTKFIEDKKALVLDKMLSINQVLIPDCEIVAPYETNYTISFSLFIENYYNNYAFWRHILHKGTALEDTYVIDYQYLNDYTTKWDELTSIINRQSPGVWLHPNKNIIRFCIETVSNDTEQKTRLEYIDIKNIPVETLFHLCFVMNKNVIIVYQNSKLISFHQLKGVPNYNRGPLYFHHEKTYSGYIKNFRYYPYAIDENRVKEIAKYTN